MSSLSVCGGYVFTFINTFYIYISSLYTYICSNDKEFCLYKTMIFNFISYVHPYLILAWIKIRRHFKLRKIYLARFLYISLNFTWFIFTIIKNVGFYQNGLKTCMFNWLFHKNGVSLMLIVCKKFNKICLLKFNIFILFILLFIYCIN